MLSTSVTQRCITKNKIPTPRRERKGRKSRGSTPGRNRYQSRYSKRALKRAASTPLVSAHAPKILKATPSLTNLNDHRSTLISSPSLFDKGFIARATRDELLTTCSTANLLPRTARGTCPKRLQTIPRLRKNLMEGREKILQAFPLDKPVVFLKNEGKHLFYRITVSRVDGNADIGKTVNPPPAGGELYEVKSQWGATGMRRLTRFDRSSNSIVSSAPKMMCQRKYFGSLEAASNEARRLIELKDQARGYYIAAVDDLIGLDQAKKVKLSARRIRYAVDAKLQVFVKGEKPRRCMKLSPSMVEAKR